MIKAFGEADIRSLKALTVEDMRTVLQDVFSVPKVDLSVAEEAFAACNGGVGGKDATRIERFCEWFHVNMFKNVAVMDAASDDQITYELAKLHDVNPMIIDKVRRKFTMYDTDRSGRIDYEEFVGMIKTLLHAKSKSDLSSDRLSRFWQEIDVDHSGDVCFEEFVAWYLRYFDGECAGMSSGPVSDFYASFNPVLARRSMMPARGQTIDFAGINPQAH